MKKITSSRSPSKNTSGSKLLGTEHLRKIREASDLNGEQLNDVIRKMENDHNCSTEFWESVLAVYPIDWSAGGVSHENFRLYGHPSPIKQPYLVDGLMSIPARNDRIQKAVEKNGQAFKKKTIRIAEHRSSYARDRDDYIARAMEFTSEEKRRKLAIPSELENYKQGVFGMFASQREKDAEQLKRLALEEFYELSEEQINVKLFVEHAIPVYERNFGEIDRFSEITKKSGLGL